MALGIAIQPDNNHKPCETVDTLESKSGVIDKAGFDNKHPLSATVNEGFTCVVADNGQIALDLLESVDVDLILMDCQMPVLDGFKATQEIRRAETDSYMPIIALTANAMQEDEVKCIEAGMDNFLTKPIDRSLFEQTILHMLEKRINECNAELSSSKKAA